MLKTEFAIFSEIQLKNLNCHKTGQNFWDGVLGPTQFVRYLTFKNGKLVDMKTGDYGY